MRSLLLRALVGLCLLAGVRGQAQQTIGYVATKDAAVTGATDELDGRAVLTGSATVTAKERMATVQMSRRGEVRVCQTTTLHLTESKSAELAAHCCCLWIVGRSRCGCR
jgi:hypothetical protein